jgi:hypothetical protein
MQQTSPSSEGWNGADVLGCRLPSAPIVTFPLHRRHLTINHNPLALRSLAHLSSDHCCLGSFCCRALGHSCDPASAAPVIDAPGLTRLFDSLSSIPSPRSEASFYEGMRTFTSYASQNDLKDDDDLLSDLLVVRRASTLLREGRAHRRVVGGRPRLDPRTT